MVSRAALPLAFLLLLPVAAAGILPEASTPACSVPCGRIYPLILIQVEDPAATYDLAQGQGVEIPAMLSYKFDMTNEGYTAATPNEPIDIRFEFPRLPKWAQLQVEPDVIRVDVTDPRNVQPNSAEPTNPQASYVFTAPITIHASVIGQPILRDGYDFAKLLVFAKSTESGLYQSGYGIKEIRVIPEGALHESDVAGSRDVFTASPLPALAIDAGEATFLGTTVSIEAAASSWWTPSEFVARVSPAPSGRAAFAVHDESGALVATTPPVDASSGELRLNVTLVRPGAHTATVTLLPEPGTATPPMTLAIPFTTGDASAEGYAFPKTYVVSSRESVPMPLASAADALAQFERDVPFFAFDSAQSLVASVTLTTPTLAALERSAANLQFSVHDPDGNMLQAGSVDPTKPTWSLRVGSLPTDGWYVVRIRGIGAPVATDYDVNVEVNYAAGPEARNRADGVADITGGLLSRAGANLTLPVETLAVWAPSDVTPSLEGADGSAYALTIVDAEGSPVYASGVRSGPATFSAPAPGVYRAFVFAEPAAGGLPFSAITRAFTFRVGDASATVASSFAIDDVYEVPPTPVQTALGFHALPRIAGGTVSVEGAVEEDGLVMVRGANPGVRPAAQVVTANVAYPEPVTLLDPTAGTATTDDRGIPGLALGLALAALGASAIGIALWRRR